MNVRPNTSASISFKTRAGYAMHDPASTVFSIDNKTCYEAKIVASISSINASSGYTSGGQALSIKGFGFNGTNINVLIDGVKCAV